LGTFCSRFFTAGRIELGDPLRMVASRHSHWKPMAFRYRLLGGEIQDTTNIRRLGNGESASLIRRREEKKVRHPHIGREQSRRSHELRNVVTKSQHSPNDKIEAVVRSIDFSRNNSARAREG
jgi:hypothetical protein